MSDGLVGETRGWRGKINAFVCSVAVQRFIIVIICLNAVTLGMETSPSIMAEYGDLLIALDKIFLWIFVVELGLKLIGQGLGFFRQGWNIFDFIIVGIALLPSSGALSVLRSLRILRVLRLISVVPSMRRVVEALMRSIPGLGSILLLMSLIFYVSSVIATKLYSENFPQWFGTIGESAYSLFQIMTLESWSMGIVRPVLEQSPQAWAFFVPFILVTTFAVVNLVVGIVVGAMQEEHEEEKKADAVEATEQRVHMTDELHALRKEVAELKEIILDQRKPQ